MADLSSYTSVFRAHPTPDGGRRVSKRNRQPISCTACRIRKLKCDRQRPCSACTKRADGNACDFTASTSSLPAKSDEKSTAEAQARLQRLEEMVNGFIQSKLVQTDQHAHSADILQNEVRRLSVQPLEPIQDKRSNGHLSQQLVDTNYVGFTHWAAVLESIHDIQDYLDIDEETASGVSPVPSSDGSIDPILGSLEAVTVEEMLEALPPRHITDRLLSVYFNTAFIANPFLHSRKFQREYERFLRDPSSQSLLWVSILYSALCVSSKIGSMTGQTAGLPSEQCDSAGFFARAGQCLIAGQYLRDQPYAIEALLIYAHSKYTQSRDPDPTTWSLFGLCTRLAQRSGYHRDPALIPGKYTPFEIEMRRRVWFFIEAFDLLLSFQVGMPTIIHESEYDTEIIRNFLDIDFDEDTKVMPPERPSSEATPIIYYCYKARLNRVFRRVLHHVSATKLPSFEQVIELNRQLHDLRSQVPPCLQSRPIRSTGFTDHAALIMQRMMLELLHLKNLCILNRYYINFERDNSRYDEVRKTCRDAALRIIDINAEFQEETQPGHRLFEDKWMMSSIALHDHLLASMIICLDVSESTSAPSHERERKLSALRTSYLIWAERSAANPSRDAMHATRILSAILNKVSDEPLPTPPSALLGPSAELLVSPFIPSSAAFYSASSDPLHRQVALDRSSGFTNGLETGFLNNSDTQFAGPPAALGAPDFSFYEPIDSLFTNPAQIDWNLVDTFIFGRGGAADVQAPPNLQVPEGQAAQMPTP